MLRLMYVRAMLQSVCVTCGEYELHAGKVVCGTSAAYGGAYRTCVCEVAHRCG